MLFEYVARSDYLNLAQIADSGQCFRWRRIGDTWSIPIFDEYIHIREIDKSLFQIATALPKWYVYNYFDFRTDYSYIISNIPEEDVYLRAAADKFSGVRILHQDLWEVIVSFIISQNNNIQRIKSTIERMCQLNFGKLPNADQFCGLDLTKCGLGYRYDYLHQFQDRLRSADMLSNLQKYYHDYEQAKQYLLSFKGIGPKVADCICLFGMHQLNACPVDTWMKRIIDIRYDGIQPAWMKSKYAGVYQQYAFCYERYLQKEDNY